MTTTDHVFRHDVDLTNEFTQMYRLHLPAVSRGDLASADPIASYYVIRLAAPVIQATAAQQAAIRNVGVKYTHASTSTADGTQLIYRLRGVGYLGQLAWLKKYLGRLTEAQCITKEQALIQTVLADNCLAVREPCTYPKYSYTSEFNLAPGQKLSSSYAYKKQWLERKKQQTKQDKQ